VSRGSFASIVASPPAFTSAQTNSATPTSSRNGEPHVSRNLMDSMPRSTIHTLRAQKIRKQIASPVLRPSAAGSSCGMVAMPGHITSIIL